MARHFQSRFPSLVIVGFVVIALLSSCATTPTPAPSASATPPPTAQPPSYPPSPSASIPPTAYPTVAPYFPTPDRMDLCGEPVPLESQDVRERFDKEFTIIVYNHAQVYLWLKRMERYLPYLEERLRSLKLPDDLKWVVIAETDLLPGSAAALRQQGASDRRNSYDRSGDGAFLYISDLQKRFNSWSLAIAAYNLGERRVFDESQSQGVRDFYRMKLPLETERYVFRILAIKAVLGNPTKYGYNLPKAGGTRN